MEFFQEVHYQKVHEVIFWRGILIHHFFIRLQAVSNRVRQIIIRSILFILRIRELSHHLPKGDQPRPKRLEDILVELEDSINADYAQEDSVSV